MKVTKHITLNSLLAVKLVEEKEKKGRNHIDVIEEALWAYFENRIKPREEK